MDGWSDTYDLVPQIDACLLWAHMYPGYESYWSAIAPDPLKPFELTGRLPTPAEIDYARFATRTPRHALRLIAARPFEDGRVGLSYEPLR